MHVRTCTTESLRRLPERVRFLLYVSASFLPLDLDPEDVAQVRRCNALVNAMQPIHFEDLDDDPRSIEQRRNCDTVGPQSTQ